jgi:multiple sugar transport system substrate-binding protein
MRRLAAVIWVVVLAAACGSAGDERTARPQVTLPAGSPFQVSTLEGEISFGIFGDPAERAAYEQLVDAFGVYYPQVEVNLLHVPGQEDYQKRLAIDFAAGNPPDVVLLNYRRFAALAAEGQLEPLGPYLDGSRYLQRGDYYQQALDAFLWHDQLQCIPQNISSLVVYYNKALFDAAGVPYPRDDWTWADFLDTAKALTKDADGDGIAEQYGLATDATVVRVAPFIWQNGGRIVDDERNPTKLVLYEPEAIEAIQWFVDLQVTHRVVPDPVQEMALAHEDRFLQGQVAMFLNSRRGTPTYREIEELDWDVASLPRGEERVGVLHSDAFCMTAKTEDKEAAWAFIEFASAVEGQSILAATGRTVPSLKQVAESTAFLDPAQKPANSRVFIDTIPYIRALPNVETWMHIEIRFDEELERAFHGLAPVEDVLGKGIRETADLLPVNR